MGSFGNGLTTGFNIISEIRANRLARKDIKRRQAADDALVAKYGVEAGDPNAYASVQQTTSNIDAQHRSDALGLLGALDSVNAAIPAGTPPEQAAQMRGAAFDKIRDLLPALGVDAAHIDPFKERFMKDPAVIAALTEKFGNDPLIGSPNLVDSSGQAAGVTKSGKVRTFTGFKPTSTNNVELQTAATAERDLAPSRQAGVVYDKSTGKYVAKIVEGSPQAAKAEKDQLALDAEKKKQADAAASTATALQTSLDRLDVAKGNIDRALGIIDKSPLFQNDSLPLRAARVAEAKLPTSQFHTNIAGLKNALKLIDLQQLRASGFSLGRVTNIEFQAAADALGNLDPNLGKDELKQQLNMVREHLDRFAASLREDVARQKGSAPAAAAPAESDISAIDDAFSKYGK